MRKERLLLLTSTLLALGVGEIFLAHFFPQRTVSQYLQDRPAVFRANETLFMDLQPNFRGYLKEDEFRHDVSINSLGHRQGEFSEKKGDGMRILVVGDSFTFGYGVEEQDGYVRVIERTLNARIPENRVEAINAGVPAWWTDAYYLYLKTRGIALQPDVVVVGLFMGNDIDARDARHAVWPKVDKQGLPLTITSHRVRIDNGHRVRTKRRARWSIPILRNSHLFQLLYSSTKNIGRVFKPKVQAATLYQENYSEETSAIIEKVQRLILGMAQLTSDSGAKFVVAMIPERQQVYLEENVSSQVLDFAKPQRLFATFFEQQKINYVDLLPAIRAAAATSNEELFYRRDSHFTKIGYRVAGEEIARRLTDLERLPTQ